MGGFSLPPAKKKKGNKMVRKKQEIKSVDSIIDAKQLQSFIDKIERLEEEMANIKSDIKNIYAEAKCYGYDPKIMKIIIKLRKMEDNEICELDELTETYRKALNI